MPKLLQINTTLNIGSTGRIAEQISMIVGEHGWKCYLAHGGRYIGISKFPTYQISAKWDNDMHALKG